MGGGVCKGAGGPCTQERGTRVRVWRMRRAPAVPDGRWSGLHACVGEGRAPTQPHSFGLSSNGRSGGSRAGAAGHQSIAMGIGGASRCPPELPPSGGSRGAMGSRLHAARPGRPPMRGGLLGAPLPLSQREWCMPDSKHNTVQASLRLPKPTKRQSCSDTNVLAHSPATACRGA